MVGRDELREVVPLDRLWLPLGSTYRLDQSGWLLDPADCPFYAAKSDALTTKGLTNNRCLVLLGEPGVGKSSALAAHDPLIPAGALAEVFTVDLAPFSSEDRLVRRVFEGEKITAWVAGKGVLCLTLDSFDEAHTRIETLHLLLGEYLDQWDCSRLLLRVVCRTAEWPKSLEAALRRNFDSVDRYELLPLRRTDAAALVASQVDADAFLGAVEAANAVPLAARPLTLKLLAAAYVKSGSLPRRGSEVYERGLLTLCEEMNPERREGNPVTAAGAKSRLKTASRIAALSIFGGLPTVWTGPIVEADSTDLTIDDCTRTSAVASSQPILGVDSVVAALRTGLFTGAGSERLGWSHATFADFLAARWIVSHDLEDGQVSSILVSGDGRMHPRVRQVAAWVVAIEPARFAWLIPVDPEAFLLNVDIPDDALRLEVVAEVLAGAKAGHLYHDYVRNFAGVKHPLLADQLREVLVDGAYEVRRVAVDIARQCSVVGLVPELTVIALDGTAEEALRVSAALAVNDLSEDSPSHDLVSLVRSPVAAADGTRPDRELEAAALLASWPHAISTAEVFDLLDPHYPRNYFGLYSMFVSAFAKSLTEDDLETACVWLTNNPGRLNDSRLAPLVNAIVLLGIGHLDRPDALAAVKSVAFARADNYEPLFSDDALEGEHELTANDRHSLTLALLEDASDGQVLSIVDSMGGHGLSLIGLDDFEWLVDRYATADGVLKENVARAINYILVPDNLMHADVILSLASDHPAAGLLSYWRDPVVLDSDEATTARETWRQHAEAMSRLSERRNRKRPDRWVNARIAKLAAKAKEGDAAAFWQAAHFVTVRPRTLHYMDEHEPDLTAHPRWKTLKGQTRKDMVEAAALYVRAGKCNREAWFAQNLRSYPAEAGYRALILLLRTRPQELETIEPDAWKEWAPIMVSWTATINGARAEDKQTLFRLALPYAREELTSALLQLVDKAIAEEQHTFLHEELDELHSEDLAAALIERLQTVDVGPLARAEILETLTTHCMEVVRPVFLAWLEPEPRAADRIRACDAIGGLLWSDARTAWPTLSELMLSDPEFMKEALLAAIGASGRGAPDLAEDQLADLYIWLVDHFPADEDPRFEEVHAVGPRESLGTWRDSILANLKQAGTRAAVAAVARIADTYPDEPWLKHVLIDAQRAYRAESWEPLTAPQLDELTAHRESRLVRTEADLVAVTLKALETIQVRLQADTPASALLWDTHSKRPKSEDEVSDYLAIELRTLLRERGAIVNREVQVRRVRPSGLAERTDIRVDAITPGANSDSKERICVVGEVKGSWNSDILDSLQTQLVERYMADLHTDHGIYIVIWFDFESWQDTKDTRRSKAKAHNSASELQTVLEARAELQRKAGRHVAVVVLDASLRRPHTKLESNDAT